jgi:hypothetical protein
MTGILEQIAASNQNINDKRKLDAWTKAQPYGNYDLGEVRKDACGAPIVWADYGKQTQYGWEVDHILPVSRFLNADQPINVQALQWQNNRAKSNSIGINYCVVGGLL